MTECQSAYSAFFAQLKKALHKASSINPCLLSAILFQSYNATGEVYKAS